MGYESLHILKCAMPKSRWCNLYCCLQCTVVLVGVVLKDLLGGTMMWQCDHDRVTMYLRLTVVQIISSHFLWVYKVF